MPSSDIQQQLTKVAYHGVFADAFFATRIIPAMSDPNYGSYIALIASPWWALYLHEARPVIQERIPELSAPMSLEAEQSFAHARHGTKMFLDTKRPIRKYEEYFADIAKAQRELFASKTIRPLRRFTTDLGLIKYRDRVVISSHGVTFSMNLEPSEVLNEEVQNKLRRLWSEAGAFFGSVIQGEQGPLPSIFSAWEGEYFSSEDVQSEKYYTMIFTGSEFPNLNAVLLHFTSMINAVHLLFPVTTELAVDAYVLLKIRYVLAYHVAESLKRLASEARTLDLTSQQHLSFLVDEAPQVSSMQNAWLRNLLVHYVPSKRSDLTRYEPGDLLQSAVAMTNNTNTSALITEIDSLLAHLAQGLNIWLTAPNSDKQH